MKITDAEYRYLLDACRRVLADDPHLLSRMQRDTDWSPERMRWNLFHRTGIRVGDGAGMPGDWDVYAYANDDHIDTALKQVCRDVGEPYCAS